MQPFLVFSALGNNLIIQEVLIKILEISNSLQVLCESEKAAADKEKPEISEQIDPSIYIRQGLMNGMGMGQQFGMGQNAMNQGEILMIYSLLQYSLLIQMLSQKC